MKMGRGSCFFTYTESSGYLEHAAMVVVEKDKKLAFKRLLDRNVGIKFMCRQRKLV